MKFDGQFKEYNRKIYMRKTFYLRMHVTTRDKDNGLLKKADLN